jgi:hypothetical protein
MVTRLRATHFASGPRMSIGERRRLLPERRERWPSFLEGRQQVRLRAERRYGRACWKLCPCCDAPPARAAVVHLHHELQSRLLHCQRDPQRCVK